MYTKNLKKLSMIMLCITVIMLGAGCNKNDGATKVNNEENIEETIKATPEPCVYLNEWDSSLFEVFGYPLLDMPLNSFYPKIEKGRTYLIGEYYTDELDSFLMFFKDIYQKMWGEIVDALQVLDVKDGVYSFEGEYVVKDIYREVEEYGYDLSDRPEKNAYISVVYNEKEKKCVVEFKMLKNATTRKENK